MNTNRRSVLNSERVWISLTVVAMFALAAVIATQLSTKTEPQPVTAPTPEPTQTPSQAEADADVQEILDSGFRLQSPVAPPSES